MLRLYAIGAGGLRPLAADLSQGLPREAAWIDLVTPTPEEESALERALGIAVPTREEAGGIQASDRLVARNGTLLMSALVPVGPHPDPADTIPITFVRTGERLVTVRYGRAEALDPFIERYASGEIEADDASGLLAALLEAIVDRVADQLEEVGHRLDRLGRAVFHRGGANARRQGTRRLPLGRNTDRLQEAIEDIGMEHARAAKLRECVQSLLRLAAFAGEHAQEVGLHKRLKAVETDLRAAAEYNAFLAGNMEFILDATVGLIDIQQNKAIYMLTIVSVLLTPPVLVASVYGMNFHDIPELGWHYGYAWALGLMALSALVSYLLFKRRGWL
ncbi:CorA family divalent cation transporter [Benzoatithermus flavus]|uniref:CorA family divalent cation transporter n=1 Tax=Benzoatithermus flavus TaxID=3108223 RepID=A0ABU8XT37_9PROT